MDVKNECILNKKLTLKNPNWMKSNSNPSEDRNTISSKQNPFDGTFSRGTLAGEMLATPQKIYDSRSKDRAMFSADKSQSKTHFDKDITLKEIQEKNTEFINFYDTKTHLPKHAFHKVTRTIQRPTNSFVEVPNKTLQTSNKRPFQR